MVRHAAASTAVLLAFVAVDTAAGVWLQRETLPNIQGLLYLAVQLTTLIVVTRRTAADAVDSSARVVTAGMWCAVYPYAAYFAGRPSTRVPPMLIDGLLVAASLLAWRSVAALNRSFGFRPARRALVTRGPYQTMRHPLYTSYMLADVALCLTAPQVSVVSVVATGWVGLAIRLAAEERVLRDDPEWPAYAARVKYRLWPGIL